MKLTPTEDLLIEVLAARFRLGERLWTFDTSTRKAALKLESKGLINLMHGIVEKTYRASLTEAGKALVIDASYSSPLEAEVIRLTRKVRKLKRLV